MSKSPLPSGNPRQVSPRPTGSDGRGINWGERMGGGCWKKRVLRPSRRPRIDRDRSTIQG